MKDKEKYIDTSWRAKMVENGIYKDSEITSEEMIEENELIEIANTIVETDFTYRGMCWQGDSFVSCPYGEPINCQSCLTAKNILDKGYRKIPENSIVLSREELNKNYVSRDTYDAEIKYRKVLEKRVSKETAEKFAKAIEFHSISKRDKSGYETFTISNLCLREILREEFGFANEELAKQFNVEIKES